MQKSLNGEGITLHKSPTEQKPTFTMFPTKHKLYGLTPTPPPTHIHAHTNYPLMPLRIQGYRTHGETHQIECIEAYLWQNNTVSSVGVEGRGLDVGPVKILQVQWPLTLLFAKGNQGTDKRVLGRAADGPHCTHLVEVQQETGVILENRQIQNEIAL